MEYSRALKSSFLSETTMKCNQQVFLDDIWCLTGINNVVVSSDDFSVDDLLDFSHKEDFNQLYVEESEEFEDKDLCLSVSSENRGDVFVGDHCFSNSDAGSGVFQPLPAGELPVPVDEMEDLEWLSQFVDDSASGMSLLCRDDINCKEKIEIIDINQSEPDVKTFTVLGLPYPVPKKARSKRSRKPSEHMWSLDLLLLTESLSSSLSSSQDSSLTGSTSSFMPVIPIMDSFGDMFQTQVTKKQKRNRGVEPGSQSDGSQSLRWCSHCLVQKTPQWRTGPLGPKTLCNACGVRFKSGRLFPEYRPACSPTFAGDIHSNSHRKVLEMRRKKEAVEFVMAGLTQNG